MANRIILTLLAVAFAVTVTACGKEKRIAPAEAPEEVVSRFYSYIKEGGTTTLGEAYRLISKKRYEMHVDIFKNTVKRYPRDMQVKVLGCTINDETQIAVVTIEFRTASTFGGYYTTESDINLELDKETNTWKIDFTGETYDESPGTYAM